MQSLLQKHICGTFLAILTVGLIVVSPGVRADDSGVTAVITFPTGTEATAINSYVAGITQQQQACIGKTKTQQDYETCLGTAYANARSSGDSGTKTGGNPTGLTGNTSLDSWADEESKVGCTALGCIAKADINIPMVSNKGSAPTATSAPSDAVSLPKTKNATGPLLLFCLPGQKRADCMAQYGSVLTGKTIDTTAASTDSSSPTAGDPLLLFCSAGQSRADCLKKYGSTSGTGNYHPPSRKDTAGSPVRLCLPWQSQADCLAQYSGTTGNKAGAATPPGGS